MERISLKNLTEEEKIERKKQQKRDAQKRYYQRNKEKWQDYANNYYSNMKKENKELTDTLLYIRDYIKSVPNYKMLTYFTKILEVINNTLDEVE